MLRGNFYELLALKPGATAEQIERAYRLCKALYRDDSLATYSVVDAEEIRASRARIDEAYEVLRDPIRRIEYDARHGFTTPAEVAAARAGEPVPAAAAVAPTPAPAAVIAPPPPEPPPAPRGPVPIFPMHREAEARRLRGEPERDSRLVRPEATRLPSIPATAKPAFVRVEGTPPEFSTGPELRQWREDHKVPLRDIALETKIPSRTLEAIEGDKFPQLPPPVYLRSFLQQYARSLGLDGVRTAERYMARLPRPR